MKSIDKFATANRLAAAAELNKPRDERAEMRPLTPAEVREREFVEVKGKREFQRWTANRYIWVALARILWPNDPEYGRPSEFDVAILSVMDDADIRDFVGRGENVDRLILFRDNLRARMTS